MTIRKSNLFMNYDQVGSFNGLKSLNYGVDAQNDERYYELGKSLKRKGCFWKVIIILIVLLLLFDVIFMKGGLFINSLLSLLK